MTVAVDLLREKAKLYELNALANRDAGQITAATTFSTIAIVLFEIADALEVAA